LKAPDASTIRWPSQVITALRRWLFISPHTVNTHLRRGVAQLHVSNQLALAAVAHHSIE
jgi:hypothetical protein